MNKWLERAVILAVGAGIGSSAIYLGLKEKLEQAYSDKLEVAIAREQEAYRIAKSKLHTVEEKIVNPVKDINEEEVKVEEITAFYKPPLDELVTNYDKLQSQEKEQKDEEKKKSIPEPYFISIDDFGEKENYDSVTIRHFDKDVYSYEDGDFIYKDEIERLLGKTYIDTVERGNLADICYVRNEKMERDYEVTRQYMTYDQAFGMSEPRRIGG